MLSLEGKSVPRRGGLPAQAGFSLVEVVVGAAVFLVVAVSVYQGYLSIYKATAAARYKVIAAALANERIEIIRNVPYSDIGIANSIPLGTIPREQELVRDGVRFLVTTTVRNVDDPFDGVLGGTPSDTAPADYKLVALDIECLTCKWFVPMTVTTRVSPKNLESASTNGALFVQVFDANGLPIRGAEVHVENNALPTPIVIDDVTNDGGMLQLVDIPPGVGAYEISVGKDGYSLERTYAMADPVNPNPAYPHATVVVQAVTQTSFSIDRLSRVNVSSASPSCDPVGNVDFAMKGSKLIGSPPDVYKHSYSLSTGSNGRWSSSTVEWDTYSFTFADPSYDLIGVSPLGPVSVAPDSDQDVQLVVGPKNPRTLLVGVKDGSTGLPLSGATVRLSGNGTSSSRVTGQGFFSQSDWSGGGGQAGFSDETMYFSSDNNVETSLPQGELRLKNAFGMFEQSGYVVSSTFDVGSSTNFLEMTWLPSDQPTTTGAESVKFQVATNDDGLTWDFAGPDGTAGSFYTAADRAIAAAHDGRRYLRYKAYLSTADAATSPSVTDVGFTFTTSCMPPGQVSWGGLAAGEYSVRVTKPGYQDFETTHTILPGDEWGSLEITLTP